MLGQDLGFTISGVSPREEDAHHHEHGCGDHAPCDRLVQQEAGQCEAEEGLQLLQLADARDAADREPAIPEDESDEHAEDRDISEPDPGRRAHAAPCL